MKFFLFALLLAGTALNSVAQTRPASGQSNVGQISIGLDAGLPVGDASTVFGSVIGGSLKFEQPIATNAYFTISAGYSAYLTKSRFKDVGLQSSFGFIPLKAGFKYYTEPGLFVEGQLGVVFSTESGGSSAFVYSPGVGYTFASGFELGIRYEAWSKNGTTGQAALRVSVRL